MLDGAADSAVAATVGATPEPPPAEVTREGIWKVIPEVGSVPRLTASRAGAPKRLLE